MTSFPMMVQVWPPSLVLHKPLPNVPQYAQLGLLGSNTTLCGSVPFRCLWTLSLSEGSITRSEFCIPIIKVCTSWSRNTYIDIIWLTFLIYLVHWLVSISHKQVCLFLCHNKITEIRSTSTNHSPYYLINKHYSYCTKSNKAAFWW